ncbi:MAG: hypothetical protein F6J93_11445 [Oscillatoria sp. SIO1A7]|nr:hypothetical protein [Oscillatoria sp. SIO1A7]
MLSLLVPKKDRRVQRQLLQKIIAFFVVLIAFLALAILPNTRANTEELEGKKIIEWGWSTPSPTYIKEHIEELEQLPFDGLGIELKVNQGSIHPYNSGWNYLFSWNVWGRKALNPEDYSESIEALKNTQFNKFTDNFLIFHVMPGIVDWYDDDFKSVIANVKLAAEIVKDCHLKGILLDVEHYRAALPPFSYASQLHSDRQDFEDYQKKVRARGREFMKAINKVSKEIDILLTFGYQISNYQNQSLEASVYGLLPAFLDGMLEAAANSMIFDGWEYSYGYKTEKEFEEARKSIKINFLDITKVRESFIKHYRASFGLWVDYRHSFDRNDFNKNYFTPKDFESSVKLALKHSDRYVWIWSESIGWWKGQMPQPYIDALKKARES